MSLYREAIIYFLGGTELACPEIDLLKGIQVLGRQQVCLVADDTAFSCTAITESRDKMIEHQRRFLNYTRLRHIQWVNLNRHDIEFTTISKED